MPFSGGGGIPYDFRGLLNKALLLLGILIIIYAILWILAVLHIIPAIIYSLFPQIVLLCIGIFIVYMAYKRRNKYY